MGQVCHPGGCVCVCVCVCVRLWWKLNYAVAPPTLSCSSSLNPETAAELRGMFVWGEWLWKREHGCYASLLLTLWITVQQLDWCCAALRCPGGGWVTCFWWRAKRGDVWPTNDARVSSPTTDTHRHLELAHSGEQVKHSIITVQLFKLFYSFSESESESETVLLPGMFTQTRNFIF